MNGVYDKLATNIIEHQEQIIGPVAIDRAKQVQGLDVDWDSKTAHITKDPMLVIDNLVAKYKELFGDISVEVCKEAVGRLAQELTADELPSSLR